MNKIKWAPDELQTIKLHGAISPAAAEKAMIRSGMNFDDVERINGREESHIWGSDADRRYRQRAINAAVAIVARNPMQYAEGASA